MTFIVVAVLVAVVLVAGVFVLRQMFPTTESVQQAVTCGILRVSLNSAESAIEKADASEAEKAEIRQELEQVRSQYAQECGPPR